MNKIKVMGFGLNKIAFISTLVILMSACTNAPKCDEIAEDFALRVMNNDFDGGTNLVYDFSDCRMVDDTTMMNIFIRFNGNFFKSNIYEIQGTLKVDELGNESISNLSLNATAESYIEQAEKYKTLISVGKLLQAGFENSIGSSDQYYGQSDYDVVSCDQCRGTGEDIGGSGSTYYREICGKCNGARTIYRKQLGYY